MKQQPNFTLLSWNLPIESIYLHPLIVIAVICIGFFASPGNSSGTWLLLLVLLCSLLKSEYCSGFQGHLAARTDAVSCCEEEHSFRRLAIPCDFSRLKTLDDAYELEDVFFHENNLSSKIFSAVYFRSYCKHFGFVFHHSWTSFYPIATWGIVTWGIVLLYTWYCVLIVLLLFIIGKLKAGY